MASLLLRTAATAPVSWRPRVACRGRQRVVAGAADTAGGDRAELKRAVLRLVARTDRGKSVTTAQTAEILEAVRALEALNPTTDPAASPLVSGTWSLLFTGAADEATAAERRRREGAVGSAVTELTGAAGAASAASAPLLKGGDPTRARGTSSAAGDSDAPLGRTLTTQTGAVNNRGNTQIIEADEGRVQNIADLDVLGVPCQVLIQGTCAMVPREQTEGEARRLAVTFKAVELRVGPLGPLVVPLGWANGGKGPQGWVDTTYVDDEVRVGRGDKGSIFVAARKS